MEAYVMAPAQSRYWIATIPKQDWSPDSFAERLPEGISYCRGQAEVGESGYEHWQLVLYFKKPTRLGGVKSCLCRTAHVEPTRSQAARDYVWKEATSVDGSRFEYGELPVRRNSATDWGSIWDLACSGRVLDIPASIRVSHYSAIRRIRSDYGVAYPMEREVFVYVGAPGTGKSRRAWGEAGMAAYPKSPTSKFWDGYVDNEMVVMDEFRGGIDIAHLLRWLDRYPVLVEIKGSSLPLVAKKIWITSNLHPRDWYPTLDPDTLGALLRRLQITVFPF